PCPPPSPALPGAPSPRGESGGSSLPCLESSAAAVGAVQRTGSGKGPVEQIRELHPRTGPGRAHGGLDDRLGPHVRVHLGLRGLAAAQRGAECREGGVELPAVLGAGRAAGALRALSGVRGGRALAVPEHAAVLAADRKSTRLHSSHASISYAVFC